MSRETGDQSPKEMEMETEMNKKLDVGEYLETTKKVEIKLTDGNRDDVLQELVENNPDIVQIVSVVQSFDGGVTNYGTHAQWNAGETKDVVEAARHLAELNTEGGPAENATFFVQVGKYEKPK